MTNARKPLNAQRIPAKPESENRKSARMEDIALKAYELYERRGRREGRDLEDWLEAERLMQSAADSKAPARPKSASKAGRSKSRRDSNPSVDSSETQSAPRANGR